MFDNTTKYSILIVDDIPENINILPLVLSEYECFVALSGQEALKIAKEKKPDLILLDIIMPEPDGFEVCKRLKENPDTNEIPVIFITAKDKIDDELKGFELGALDFIRKPISPPIVKARVKTHLELNYTRKQLEYFNNFLEQKIIERTDLFISANKKLTTLENTKNCMLGLLSHELNTPLIGINGNAKLIKEITDVPEIIECCDDILLSEQRLRKFAEISLIITSIGTDIYKVNKSYEKIIDFIDISLIGIIDKIKLKNIEVKVDISNTDFNIESDYYLMKKVFDFIIENAVKFSNKKIIIRDKCDDGKFKILIRDDGKGFSKEILEKQFELFEIENLMSHTEGTGLSLVAAKAILELHDFRIKMNNAIDGGAIVELCFN